MNESDGNSEKELLETETDEYEGQGSLESLDSRTEWCGHQTRHGSVTWKELGPRIERFWCVDLCFKWFLDRLWRFLGWNAFTLNTEWVIADYPLRNVVEFTVIQINRRFESVRWNSRQIKLKNWRLDKKLVFMISGEIQLKPDKSRFQMYRLIF